MLAFSLKRLTQRERVTGKQSSLAVTLTGLIFCALTTSDMATPYSSQITSIHHVDVILIWFCVSASFPCRPCERESCCASCCDGLSKPCALRSVALRDCESSASYFSFELNFRCLSKTPSAIALLRELQRASIVCFTGRGKSDLVLKLVKPHQSPSTESALSLGWCCFPKEPIQVSL